MKKIFRAKSDAPPGAQRIRADRRLRRLGAKHRPLGQRRKQKRIVSSDVMLTMTGTKA